MTCTDDCRSTPTPPHPLDRLTPLRCKSCSGQSGHAPSWNDGPASVCVSCVIRCGRIAADPLSASPGELALFTETSGDVVRLGAMGWEWRGP